MPKAVFAGCARSCAPYLGGVLANIEALGSTYDAFEVVIVENDSADDTRARLQAYAASRPHVRLIDADGLDQAHPRRGDRLAVARNIYAEALGDRRYDDCDDLVVLDFDDVNCAPIDKEAFMAARRWLWAEPNRRGVFANSAPFYYDIWPLRHPTWCPDDCWSRVRKSQARLGFDDAARRHVARLQVPIPPATPPIMVDSAFGGLGIYRKEATLGARYAGLTPDDEEVCDHVAFNAGVKGTDGVLAIYPALQNRTPVEHILGSLGRTKAFTLQQGGRKCTLIGPAESPRQRIRLNPPTCNPRFPALARILFDQADKASLIDIGANLGGAIALSRLAGAGMPAIAIEQSLTSCKLLWANVKRSPALFRNVRLVWGRIGSAGASGEAMPRAPRLALGSLAGDRDVSLLRAAGPSTEETLAAELAFVRTKQPVLWLCGQGDSAADENKWRALIATLSGESSKLVLFDDSGAAIFAGGTSELADRTIEQMASAGRHFELAVFPPRFEQAYGEFRQSLTEIEG